MKKQLTAIALTVLIVLASGLTALAAPEVVNAGGVWITFDSEYYAANNPDVVAAVGTGANALLQHYLTAGQYEGRLCCASGTQVGTAKILSESVYHSNVIITPATKLSKIVRHKADGTITSTQNISYDSKGNLISDDNTTYEYDNYGNLIKQVWSSGLMLTYDGQGNMTAQQSVSLVIPVDLIYDNAGKLVEEVRHEGFDGKDVYRLKHSYDKGGELVSTVSGYDHKGTDFVEIRRYDELGNMIYRGQNVGLEALPFPGYNQEIQMSLYYEYSYDSAGRLIRENDVVYEYDSRGNMVKRTGSDGGWYEYIYD